MQKWGFLSCTALYKGVWAGALWQGNVSRDLRELGEWALSPFEQSPVWERAEQMSSYGSGAMSVFRYSERPSWNRMNKDETAGEEIKDTAAEDKVPTLFGLWLCNKHFDFTWIEMGNHQCFGQSTAGWGCMK